MEASSTVTDVFETIVSGVYYYFADMAVYLFVFTFMFGMFTSLLVILALWRKR